MNKNYYKCVGCGECVDATENHGQCENCGGTKWIPCTDTDNIQLTADEQIEKLYKEPMPENLRADLIDEGIKTLEAAYVQGFRHGLAELKMRLAEPPNEKS
jgi:hypothetical protein